MRRQSVKNKAFTLAELMVIMAIMAVLMAAFSPVFTAKYRAHTDSVWTLTNTTSYNDISSDAPNKALLQESFIGITPISGDEIRSNVFSPASKLNIRSIASLDGSPQKQIEFRYNGNRNGYLFAGNKNFLLGGTYSNLTCSILGACAQGNTAFGSEALNSVTTGNNNTALGYRALSSLTAGSNNTIVGYQSGSNISGNTKGNVAVGYFNTLGNYNTVIGNLITSSSSTKYSTAIGSNINATNSMIGVAVGENSYSRGTGNTAVGANALNPDISNSSSSSNNYSYVTAIGYNSCKGLSNNSEKKTCIGGEGITSVMSSSAKSLYNDSYERVFIGGSTYYNGGNGSAAVLEVHNITGTNNYLSPDFGNEGRETVVINGNMIVRGQSYFSGHSPYPFKNLYQNDWTSGTRTTNYPALMGYKLWHMSGSNTTFAPLIGDEGYRQTKRLPEMESDSTKYKLHADYQGREHCICTYSCGSSDKRGLNSYEWTAFKQFSGIIPDFYDGPNYYYLSPSDTNLRDYCGNQINSDSYSNGIPLDNAHGLADYGSCCPILTNDGRRVSKQDYVSSDKRLKNIFEPYTPGLESLKYLSVFNYKFKDDAFKTPRVGVIAQQLLKVFPNAVTKNAAGYYEIRWDEMFYASINAVKEINEKINNLNGKISSDISRLKSLKEKNIELEKKLDILSHELDILENK